MPFTLPSSFDWFNHRLLVLRRLLYRQKADYFLGYYKGFDLKPITDLSGEALHCPICGFFMAELILKQGWSVKSCSAVGFKKLVDNPDFSRCCGSFFSK